VLPAAQRQRVPREAPPVEPPANLRQPELNLGIQWTSAGEEFRTSLWDFFTTSRLAEDSGSEGEPALRVDWIRGRAPRWGLALSCLAHVAGLWVLTLPIRGFFPEVQPTLAPVQIEVTWYTPQDLPQILLPAKHKAANPKSAKPQETVRTAAEPKDVKPDAFHPRQTILSIPVRVTHPRQTLIEPGAPLEPPKILPPLPNIVQLGTSAPLKLRAPLTPANSAPVVRKRGAQEVAAPQIAERAQRPNPLDLTSTPAATPKLPSLTTSLSAPTTRKTPRADTGEPAPLIGTSSGQGEAGLPTLIALSVTPAPPSPVVTVPEGNLAARIAMSPEGAKNEGGTGGAGDAAGSTEVGSTVISTGAKDGAGDAAGESDSLPAAVSIRGGNSPGVRAVIAPSGRLILKPATPAAPGIESHRGPADANAFSPSLPPEKILSSSEVYTLHVNLPNLTSASGSWVLSFAQLDADPRPPFRPKGELLGPVVVGTADPQYPPDMVREHVAGEVVLYAIIRKDGSVDSIQVVRGLEPELDRSAIEALSQWKFQPGKRAGVPVDLEAVVHIPFNYRNPRE